MRLRALVFGALIFGAANGTAQAAERVYRAEPRQSASTSAGPSSTDFSTQRRRDRRGPTRLRVYPDYAYPGPNAVRVCEARYVIENRVLGPTVTPRMSCVWRRG